VKRHRTTAMELAQQTENSSDA